MIIGSRLATTFSPDQLQAGAALSRSLARRGSRGTMAGAAADSASTAAASSWNARSLRPDDAQHPGACAADWTRLKAEYDSRSSHGPPGP
jgi:hypothetical protein